MHDGLGLGETFKRACEEIARNSQVHPCEMTETPSGHHLIISIASIIMDLLVNSDTLSKLLIGTVLRQRCTEPGSSFRLSTILLPALDEASRDVGVTNCANMRINTFIV